MPIPNPTSHCQAHFNLGARCWPSRTPCPLCRGLRQLSSAYSLCSSPKTSFCHHPAPALWPTKCSPHLTVDVFLEVQFLLQGLQPVLSINPPQHLILKLLFGLTKSCLELRRSGGSQREGSQSTRTGKKLNNGCSQASFIYEERSRESEGLGCPWR